MVLDYIQYILWIYIVYTTSISHLHWIAVLYGIYTPSLPFEVRCESGIYSYSLLSSNTKIKVGYSSMSPVLMHYHVTAQNVLNYSSPSFRDSVLITLCAKIYHIK